MDERSQFTFYRSYWDAIENLPDKQQLPVLKAIIRYALFGEYPTSLPSVCRAFFLLVQPTLDASRKKAASGKRGGSKAEAKPKQNESKTKANQKQSANEKEKEKEEEKEEENECYAPAGAFASAAFPPGPPTEGKTFTSFWDAYPKKIGRDAAWNTWKELRPDAQTAQEILSGLDRWKKSEQWQEDGGRYIPRAAKFLSEQHWQSPPVPLPDVKGRERQLDEDEQAAIQRMLNDTFPDGDAAGPPPPHRIKE